MEIFLQFLWKEGPLGTSGDPIRSLPLYICANKRLFFCASIRFIFIKFNPEFTIKSRGQEIEVNHVFQDSLPSFSFLDTI